VSLTIKHAACKDGTSNILRGAAFWIQVVHAAYTNARSAFGLCLIKQGNAAWEIAGVQQLCLTLVLRCCCCCTHRCCTAACEFNANYCNCEQGVLDFATQLTGGNINIYRSSELTLGLVPI
jgi:hypothetical protein